MKKLLKQNEVKVENQDNFIDNVKVNSTDAITVSNATLANHTPTEKTPSTPETQNTTVLWPSSLVDWGDTNIPDSQDPSINDNDTKINVEYFYFYY